MEIKPFLGKYFYVEYYVTGKLCWKEPRFWVCWNCHGNLSCFRHRMDTNHALWVYYVYKVMPVAEDWSSMLLEFFLHILALFSGYDRIVFLAVRHLRRAHPEQMSTGTQMVQFRVPFGMLSTVLMRLQQKLKQQGRKLWKLPQG